MSVQFVMERASCQTDFTERLNQLGYLRALSQRDVSLAMVLELFTEIKRFVPCNGGSRRCSQGALNGE